MNCTPGLHVESQRAIQSDGTRLQDRTSYCLQFKEITTNISKFPGILQMKRVDPGMNAFKILIFPFSKFAKTGIRNSCIYYLLGSQTGFCPFVKAPALQGNWHQVGIESHMFRLRRLDRNCRVTCNCFRLTLWICR